MTVGNDAFVVRGIDPDAGNTGTTAGAGDIGRGRCKFLKPGRADAIRVIFIRVARFISIADGWKNFRVGNILNGLYLELSSGFEAREERETAEPDKQEHEQKAENAIGAYNAGRF